MRIRPAAVERLRMAPGVVDALLRLVLQPLDRALTDEQANRLRDRVHLALHRGKVQELTAGQAPARRRRVRVRG